MSTAHLRLRLGDVLQLRRQITAAAQHALSNLSWAICTVIACSKDTLKEGRTFGGYETRALAGASASQKKKWLPQRRILAKTLALAPYPSLTPGC